MKIETPRRQRPRFFTTFSIVLSISTPCLAHAQAAERIFSTTGFVSCRDISAALADSDQLAVTTRTVDANSWLMGYLSSVDSFMAERGDGGIAWDAIEPQSLFASIMSICADDPELRFGNAVHRAWTGLRDEQAAAGTLAGSGGLLAGMTAAQCEAMLVPPDEEADPGADPDGRASSLYDTYFLHHAVATWIGGFLSGANVAFHELGLEQGFDLSGVEARGLEAVQAQCKAEPEMAITQAILVFAASVNPTGEPRP